MKTGRYRRLDISPTRQASESPVTGQTLDERLSAGTVFEPAEVARIGIELSQALLAGARHPLGDRASESADTELYAAPETLRGESATQQSDVYSLGVLLYRLLTKTFPVSAGAVHQRQHVEARNARDDLRSRGSGVPLALARVVERAIHPRPDMRYATVDALCADLQAAERELRDLRLRRRRRYVPAAVAGLLLAALAWATAVGPRDREVLAVWFEHSGASADARAIVDGLTIEMTHLLAGLEPLEVRAALPSSAYLYTPHDVAAFGGQRRASIVLRGIMHGDAGAWRHIQAALVSVRDGRTIWSESFSVEDNDLLAMLERIGRAIAGEMRLAFDPRRRRYATTPEMQELFLRGRALQAMRSETSRAPAADLFQRVAGEAPGFVPAIAALAATLGGVRLDSQDLPALDARMAPAARRAYGEDPGLAEAHAAMGLLSARLCEWRQAEAHFVEALRRDPGMTSASIDYAISTLLPLGDIHQALAVLRAALESDPGSLGARRALAYVLVEHGDYHLAIETSRGVIEDAPQFERVDQTLPRALYLSGRMARPIEAFGEEAHWGYRGYMLAVEGRQEEARRLADAHPREPARQMLIYAGLHDRDRAYDALQRTARSSPWRALTWMRRVEIEPVFRGDPRAAALREQLTGPAAAARCAVNRAAPSTGPTPTVSDRGEDGV